MPVLEHAYADGKVSLRGYLSYDAGITGKRPAVLVVPEAPGLTEHSKRRVRMLSELGYVVMGADLYGNGQFAQNMEETMSLVNGLRADVQVWRARLTAAYEALRKHELVDATRMAATGYCFGGSSVLELARAGTDLSGVICYHGELHATAHAPGGIKAKVLVCQAADDFFATRDQLLAFQDEMTAAGVDWQVNVYGGSKHGFTNPESDRAGMPMLAYHEPSDRRSWHATQAFLAEVLATRGGNAK